MGYGTAAHEFFETRKDVIQMATIQSEQLQKQHIEINRKPILERFLTDGTTYLIVEEFDLYLAQDDYRLSTRLSTILERINNKWMVTHFHGSTPDSNIAEEEAFPMEGLRKKNEELEAKIKERTRDLEIEAALERVRAKTMSIQHQDELLDVITLLADQLVHLGINLDSANFSNGLSQKKGWDIWIYNKHFQPDMRTSRVFYPWFDHPMFHEVEALIEDYKKGIDLNVAVFDKEQLKVFVDYVFTDTVYKDAEDKDSIKEAFYNLPGYTWTVICLKDTWVSMNRFNTTPFTDEENAIFRRFANAFGQAYTRFLDLQKAEAQAREAQIEAALERARTQSMLMQHSDELYKTSEVFHEQLHLLGIESEFSYLWLPDEEKSEHLFWATWQESNKKAAFRNKHVTFPLDKSEPSIAACYVAWDSHEAVHVNPVAPDEVEEYFGTWPDLLDGIEKFKPELFPDGLYYVDAYMKYGCFGIMIRTLLSDEQKQILSRFSKEFERAYTRFLDLQKAEAQTRESQINLGVERVRAMALAMHKSEDIMKVVAKLKDEVMNLDIKDIVAATIFLNEGDKKIRMWDLTSIEKIDDGYQIPLDITFKLKKTDPHLYVKRVWENPDNYFIETQDEKGFKRLLELFREHGKTDGAEEIEEYIKSSQLKLLYHATKKLNDGKLCIDVSSPPTDEMEPILTKMGAAFDLAYKRFEDLQKAEVQAREAKIELALERVRARTMAMQQSEELSDVATVLFQQVKALGVPQWSCGFNIWETGDKEFTFYAGSQDGEILSPCKVPLNEHPVFAAFDESRARGDELYIYEKEGGFQADHYKYMLSVPGGMGDMMQGFLDAGLSFPTFQIDHVANFAYGNLIFITYEHFPEMHTVFKRFTKVFEQTYTRFLDLQKAEAQAREAQIEASLERVRSRSMAMHKSDELLEAGSLLYQELLKLGISSLSSGYNIMDADEKIGWNYMSNQLDGTVLSKPMGVPHQETEVMRSITQSWKNQEPFHLIQLDEEATKAHQTFIAERTINFNLSAEELLAITPKHLALQTFNFRQGYLLIVGAEPLSAVQLDMMLRFTKAFQQTYTRFLDLQKAEAQAREAEIELGLERVRAKAMAMQKSNELSELVDTVFKELTKLDLALSWCIINIIDEPSMSNMVWGANPQIGKEPESYHMLFEDYRFHHEMFKAWKEKQDKWVFTLKGAEKEVYDEYLFSQTEFRRVPKTVQEEMRATKQYVASFSFSNFGGLQTIGEEPLSDESLDILGRFGKVFDLTYTRFNDLQKAEAQARESQIETALERVRSRTMGMQKSDELGEVATVLFKELNQLVDNLWTCGFVLCEKDRNEDEWWLSDQNGFIPAFYLPNVGDEAHANIYNAWKRGAEYHTEQLEGDALQKHYKWLMNIPAAKKIFDEMMASGFELPTWQKLHCAYFKTGYLVIITQVPCPGEEIFKRFAQVFDLTYTRFLDLQLKETQARKLAEDKLQLEKTLSDLQATQAQLIQSEKMASLGELTAGIAHEIQNPLNFVNNFSEVSKELLGEMFEEIQNGDMEEVKAIMDDVVQNLEKINHHGKRADGIVKGMLQHSRTSSGEKELTDINALADEYLRLAYHGLRAKDKSFNATLETNFDENIAKVNVIPQDIGRVVLNLITNAFYAVNEKSSSANLSKEASAKLEASGDIKYEPTVTVTTKKEGDTIFVSVKDNGNGIPKKVLDKIFQPFFTTKPTGQGTGLGLSLSYDIIKALGGELKVETNEGEGSQFIIILPV